MLVFAEVENEIVKENKKKGDSVSCVAIRVQNQIENSHFIIKL